MASDVAALVAEMSDTLSSIRQAVDALSTMTYASRLDDLEHQRDSAIAALRANFERETDDLGSKRRNEREEAAERRRREDEEMRERRRREDGEMGARDEEEDEERDRRITEEMDGVEDEMDGMMDAVETDADAFLAEGRDELARLEERRKELNRLIDQQIQVPFPTVRTRRRPRSQRAMDAAVTSKPVHTQATRGAPFGDTAMATKESCDDRGPEVVAQPPQQAGRGSGAFVDERAGDREKDGPVSITGGIGEPGQSGRSPVDSGSLTQPGGSAEGTSVNVVEPVVGDAGPPGPPQAVESVSSDISLLSEVSAHDGGPLQLPVASAHSTSGHGTDDAHEVGESNDLTSPDLEVTEVAESEGGYFDGNGPEEQATAVCILEPEAPSDTTEDRMSEDLPFGYDAELYKADTSGQEHVDAMGASREQPAELSRAESLVETVPASSEETVDFEEQPGHEDEVSDEACGDDGVPDRNSESQIDHHLQSDVSGEDDVVHQHISKHDVQSGDGLDQRLEGEPSLTGHTADRDSPAFGDYEDHDTVPSPRSGPPDSPRYISEDWAPDDQIQTLPPQSPTPEVIDAPELPEPLAAVVYNPAGAERGDESTPETSLLARGLHGGLSISNIHDDEMNSPDDSVPGSPRISALEVPVDALGSQTSTPAPNLDYDGGADVRENFEGHVPVELPLHAMEYCSVPESVQLSDGTWSVGMIAPELYLALEAQFAVPAPCSPQVDARDLASTPPVQEEEEEEEEEEAGSLHLSDISNVAVAPHSREIFDENTRDFVSAGLAHELQPVIMQLADGTWSIDPRNEEFDAAVVLSQGGSRTPLVARYSTPVMNSADDDDELAGSEAALDLDSMAMDSQPMTVQLPNGAWATDPSEEEYRAAATQLRKNPPGIDHVAVTAEAQSTLAPDFSQKIQSSNPGPASPMPMGAEQSNTGAAWWESPQFSREQNVSVSGSETSDDEEDPSHLETEGQSRAWETVGGARAADYGKSGAGPVDTGALPWSPFNSRYPLGPVSPSAEAAQPPSLGESDDHEMRLETVTPALQDRDGMFNLGKAPASPQDGGAYSALGAPDDLLARTDTLNTAEAATDTESQSFVTPLQSAGLGAPPQFQERADLLFDNAVEYTQGAAPSDENATTVHGQDELFDSEDESDPGPNPNVDEDREPSPSLGTPPQQHHSAVEGQQVEEAMDMPATSVLQDAPEFSTPLSVRHSPEMNIPEAFEYDDYVSPLSPRDLVPAAASGSLASSRHGPGRPSTPPSQATPDYFEFERESWDASGRIDSTPMSLVSHSTLSSSPGSPVVLREANHGIEATQGSWSGHIHRLSLSGHRDTGPNPIGDYGSADDGYDVPFADGLKISEEDLPTPIATQFPAHEIERQYSPANPSPSTLIQKMRSVFESQNAAFASPPGSRPASGVFSGLRRAESPGYDVSGEGSKGGYLGEAEHEVDERSSLLGIGGG